MRIRIILAAGAMFCAAGVAQAATLPARAPGLWQSTTTVTGANGEPLPHASDVVTLSCVDPSTDLKFFTTNGSDCSSLAISGAGSTYKIDGACTQNGKPVRVDETLVYASPQAVRLTARLDAPMGPVTVTSELQWQGDCLAGMVPGDEGNMVNGMFSKADNINDPDNQ